jgi:hypothetical protein
MPAKTVFVALFSVASISVRLGVGVGVGDGDGVTTLKVSDRS